MLYHIEGKEGTDSTSLVSRTLPEESAYGTDIDAIDARKSENLKEGEIRIDKIHLKWHIFLNRIGTAFLP